MNYPPVLGELETLNQALTGRIRGFARYGDGDFGVMRGQGDVYQKHVPSLAHSLGYYLTHPCERVLNCLPRAVTERDTPFYYRWQAFMEANAGIIGLLPDRVYGSAYLSRMDSVPELHTTTYWMMVARLWAGQDVTLVRGSERSLTRDKLMHSPSPPKSVTEVLTPFRNGWEDVDETFERMQRAGNDTVILCTGLMARPLVHRWVELRGRAWDLGHLGLYFDLGRPRALQDCR